MFDSFEFISSTQAEAKIRNARSVSYPPVARPSTEDLSKAANSALAQHAPEHDNAYFAWNDRKDARDRRAALKVKNLTPAVRAAVEAAITAFDAADKHDAAHRRLDAASIANPKDEALKRRRDRAEGRWQRALDSARNATKAVLFVPTRPGPETAAKFDACLRLLHTLYTNARHRDRYSIARGVDALPEEDANALLKAALRCITAAPSAPPSPSRAAWDAAMADYLQKWRVYLEMDAAWDGEVAALFAQVFGDRLEEFTELVPTPDPARKRRALRWHRIEDLKDDGHLRYGRKQALLPFLAEALPAIEEGEREIDRRYRDIDDRHDAALNALMVLDLLPAPDLEALAFKMREQLGIEHDMCAWQVDTVEGMTEQLSTGYHAERLPFTWYQDVLRLMGSNNPVVHAKAWDPAPWIAEFRAAGGDLRLQNYGHGEDRLGKRVAFYVEPANEAACFPLMDQVRGWKNEVLTEFVMAEEREARVRKKAELEAAAQE